MIPLVKVGGDLVNHSSPNVCVCCLQMHDLATQDLALRIGGSKTGLLNASLVNYLIIRKFHAC
jgi:hypothetical protein